MPTSSVDPTERESRDGGARISIIVRTVEGGVRFRESLASLASQTIQNFEVVVIDMSAGGTGHTQRQLELTATIDGARGPAR